MVFHSVWSLIFYQYILWRWIVLTDQIYHHLQVIVYIWSQLFYEFFILYDYLYIFVRWWKPQVLCLSHFKGYLNISNNKLTGALPTEMRNMNQLYKLFCTHSLNFLIGFSFCMVFDFLSIYSLKMESVHWPNISPFASLVKFPFKRGAVSDKYRIYSYTSHWNWKYEKNCKVIVYTLSQLFNGFGIL